MSLGFFSPLVSFQGFWVLSSKSKLHPHRHMYRIKTKPTRGCRLDLHSLSDWDTYKKHNNWEIDTFIFNILVKRLLFHKAYS